MWPADARVFSRPTHFLREKPWGRGCDRRWVLIECPARFGQFDKLFRVHCPYKRLMPCSIPSALLTLTIGSTCWKARMRWSFFWSGYFLLLQRWLSPIHIRNLCPSIVDLLLPRMFLSIVKEMFTCLPVYSVFLHPPYCSLLSLKCSHLFPKDGAGRSLGSNDA